MKYFPDLIPERSKVLPDYFRDTAYKKRKKNSFLAALGWIFGCFFLLNALININHPLLTLVLALTGSILLPPVHQWIEKRLRFDLTVKIKTIFVTILLVLAAPLADHYNEADREQKKQELLLLQKEEAEKEAAERKEQQRRDSLHYFIAKSDSLSKKNKLNRAEEQLQRATLFVSTSEESLLIANEQANIGALKAAELIKAGSYKQALEQLNTLIVGNQSNSSLLYQRAVCYSRTGRMQDAVKDCKKAISLGSPDAEKFHEKINPIRRRVAYYVTLCCDGTTSSAKGRGACSHHGGVCNWNEPVYEEYRKYE